MSEIGNKAISDHVFGSQKSDWALYEAQSLSLIFIIVEIYYFQKFQVKGSLDSWINYYLKFKNRSTVFWWIGSIDLLIDYF